MAINIALISSTIAIGSTLIGGVYFAEDRYAHIADVTSIKTELTQTETQLPKTYTLAMDFYQYRLQSESRWVGRDLNHSNEELGKLRQNSRNLTPNQRLYARSLEQRIGRLLEQQKQIDTEMRQMHSPSNRLAR